ncbi:MAG: fibronectin type III domain-containing protein [Firmicutes bacterium]|nr:fibronectin type III domain-containing protein [Bacillota bacterium]
MTKQNKLLQTISTALLCMVIILVGIWTATEQSHAIRVTNDPAPSHDWYYGDSQNKNGPGIGTNKELTRCVKGVEVLGEAFVHGGNDRVDKSYGIGNPVAVKCYVDSEEERENVYIQGQKIDKGWLVRGNMQHLYNLHHSPLAGNNGSASDKNIGWPTDAYCDEFFAYEGEKFKIVDYDEDWVYFWSNGTKSYEGTHTAYCLNWLLLRSHPAGFYKMDRDYVWMNLYENDIPVKTTDKEVGIGYISKGAYLYQKPGNTGEGPCYAVGTNTELLVADATPVKSVKAGDKNEYYRVQFVGSNDTYYMGYKWYYVYVNSKYINVYRYINENKDLKLPANAAKAYIYSPSVTVAADRMYTEKSTSSKKINGYLGDGAKVYVDVDKTDDTWAAVQFNDQIGYVKANTAQSHVQYYVDDIWIQDIKDNKYVLSCGKIPAKVILKFKDKNGKTIEWTNSSGKTSNAIQYSANVTKMTVPAAVFDSKSRVTSAVKATAKVSGDDKYSASITLKWPAKPSSSFSKRSATNNVITMYGTSKGAQVQYSTSSSFKNAKSVTATGSSITVKNLKKNTKYYFRYRNTLEVDTANGKKVIYSDWSKTVTVKTTNITVKTPVLKKPVPGKKKVTLKWYKYKGTANSHELIVATNKKFTKNVKKGAATKSKCITEIRGLKAKTKYYVKMRSVYHHGSQTYYSKWTKVKSFKTK